MVLRGLRRGWYKVFVWFQLFFICFVRFSKRQIVSDWIAV